MHELADLAKIRMPLLLLRHLQQMSPASVNPPPLPCRSASALELHAEENRMFFIVKTFGDSKRGN
jgi:hypothetical protein